MYGQLVVTDGLDGDAMTLRTVIATIWLFALLLYLLRRYLSTLPLSFKSRRSHPSVTPLELSKFAQDSSPKLSTTHISLATQRHKPVRLVCISDTHGFEAELTTLPPGDVLLHCGDFACTPRFDGRTVDAAQKQFDQWLAAQPHTHKVVIAGNHDPPHAEFPRSGALYVGAGARSVDVGGVTLALVPWFRERSKTSGRHGQVTATKHRYKHFALPRGDVLVTHSPPHRVLDRCGNGERAGSSYLYNLVQRAERKPALWLCGHIHEDRGAASVVFEGGENATVVVNAANANSGIARRLVHGAVVIDL